MSVTTFEKKCFNWKNKIDELAEYVLVLLVEMFIICRHFCATSLEVESTTFLANLRTAIENAKSTYSMPSSRLVFMMVLDKSNFCDISTVLSVCFYILFW